MVIKKDWVIIGKFGRPYGIKGLVTVVSFTEPRENIINYTDWQAYVHGIITPLTLVEVKITNKYILTKVEGYINREDVAQLTNIEIAIEPHKLALLKNGEYYWHELIGMQVFNLQKNPLGVVTEILPTGANDILVVMGDKRRLIPYIPNKFVQEINKIEGSITVDWSIDF